MAGEIAVAQYVYDIVEVDGILLPTRRRAYRRDAEHRPIMDRVLVAIDLGDTRFS